MSFPDKTSLENLWDGDLGDTYYILTATEGTADSYGEKSKTWAVGAANKGRIKVLRPTEVSKEFGYLVPGDAVLYAKNTITIAQTNRVRFNSIDYEVAGIAQKKTHISIALRRLP